MQRGGSRGAAGRRSFLAETWRTRLRLHKAELSLLPTGTPEERKAKQEWNVSQLREMAALQRALRRRLQEEGRR